MTPLLLVAAEGGGIRAAYWTAAVLDKLAAVERGAKSGTPESVGSPSAGCGAGQILLASGAVSYTHLDVYKRQDLDTLWLL